MEIKHNRWEKEIGNLRSRGVELSSKPKPEKGKDGKFTRDGERIRTTRRLLHLCLTLASMYWPFLLISFYKTKSESHIVTFGKYIAIKQWTDQLCPCTALAKLLFPFSQLYLFSCIIFMVTYLLCLNHVYALTNYCTYCFFSQYFRNISACSIAICIYTNG